MTKQNVWKLLVLCLLPGVFAATQTVLSTSFEAGMSDWTQTCEHYGYVTGNTYAWIEDQFPVASPVYEGAKSLVVPNRFVNKKYHMGQLSGHQTAALWKVPGCAYKDLSPVDVMTTPVTVTAYIYDTMELNGATAVVGLNSQWICNDYGTGDPLKTECRATTGIIAAGISGDLAQYSVGGVFAGQRSLGWHEFTFSFDGSGSLMVSLDGTTYYQGAAPFQTLSSLSLFAQGATAYFDSFTMIVHNRAPIIVQPAPITVRAGATVALDLIVTDADADSLTITYDAPLASDGTWQTTKSDIGSHTVSIHVTDGEDTVSTTVLIEVVPNKAPSIKDLADVTVTTGDMVTLMPVVSDPENDALMVTYSSLISSDGTWQTTSSDAGVYSVNVTVSDGELEASTLVTIIVKPKTYTITFDNGFLVNDLPPTSSECVKEVKKNKVVNACSSIAQEYKKISQVGKYNERSRKQFEAITHKFTRAFSAIGCDDIVRRYSSSTDVLSTWILLETKIIEQEGKTCLSKRLTYDGVIAYLAERHEFDTFSVQSVDGTSVQSNTFTVRDQDKRQFMTVKVGDVVTRTIYHVRTKRTKVIEGDTETWEKGGYHLEMVIENGAPRAAVVAD